MVHKSLHFNLLDLCLDSEGRYVVLHAICDRLELVLVGIYIPPPANILLKMAPIMAQYQAVHILLAGDLNMSPNPSLGRFNSDSSVDGRSHMGCVALVTSESDNLPVNLALMPPIPYRFYLYE